MTYNNYNYNIIEQFDGNRKDNSIIIFIFLLSIIIIDMLLKKFYK